jgi:hypothetical protein
MYIDNETKLKRSGLIKIKISNKLTYVIKTGLPP